jgi:hypothetical protein
MIEGRSLAAVGLATGVRVEITGIWWLYARV